VTKIRRWLHGIKLRNRVLLYSECILFLFIITMGSVFFSLYSSEFTDESAQLYMSKLSAAEENVHSELESYSRILYTAYLDRSLHSMITDSAAIHGVSYIQNMSNISSYLETLMSGFEYMPELQLYIMEDFFHTEGPFHHIYSLENLKDEKLAKILESSNTQICWDGSLQTDENGNNVVSAAIVVKERTTGKRIALAQVIQQTKYLKRSITKTMDLQTGAYYILDNNGNIVFEGGKEFLISEFKAELSEKITPEFTGYIKVPNGITVFIKHDSKMNWQHIYITDENAYIERIFSVGRTLLLIMALLIALSVVAMILSSNVLTRNVVSLKNAVKRVSRENLVLEKIPMNNDEVGELAESFSDILFMCRELLEAVKTAEREKYAMELYALQEQVNPHFLYNSLASIRALAADIEAYTIHDALGALAKFYRLALSHGATEILVSQEIELIEKYVEICRLRFGDRLSIRIEVDEKVLFCKTPKLIVQPFIENAILHGIQNKKDQFGNVVITILRYSETELLFKICDNGIGIDAEKLKKIMEKPYNHQNHHAISSVDHRIKLHYGEEYGVYIQSIQGEGTVVEIRIPVKEALSTEIL